DAACAAAAPAHAITLGQTRLVPRSRERMTWRITGEGFVMTLGREVPAIIRSLIGDVVLGGEARGRHLAVHPGGAAILDAVAAVLEGGSSDETSGASGRGAASSGSTDDRDGAR